jgi:GNAT superfamily N-acetyltransferase
MIIIHRAEDRDAQAVLELAEAFVTSFAVDEQAFFKSYQELRANPDVFLAVAEQDGMILGYVLGFDHYTFYANGRVAWVEEITVREDKRLDGVGRLLMEAAESWARSRGSKLVALATRRAASFYLALGYEESATFFRKML